MTASDRPILIVEDNEANLDVLNRRLLRRGFLTESARNGIEALDQARVCRPVLILMDLEMPVASGFDALRELRADPILAATPVVALTAHATASVRQSCEEAGFDGFVTKPLDVGYLLEVIANFGVTPVSGAKR